MVFPELGMETPNPIGAVRPRDKAKVHSKEAMVLTIDSTSVPRRGGLGQPRATRKHVTYLDD